MKRKVKRPFDNEQFRKGYVAGMFAAEKELNTELLHFAEKAHKIMSEGTFPDYGIKINFKDPYNTITTNLDMKTEEKAKRYDEALDWMRELYPGLHGATKEDAEHYFPELKESEDERIRKFICSIIDNLEPKDFVGVKKMNVLAWLEKQKEQKPVEPSDDELQRHQDELYDFKVFATKQAKEHHISFVHDFEWNNFCTELLSYFAEQKPAEWSEEDEKLRKNIIWLLEIHPSYRKEVDWLKSLSSHSHWKPSEEQMKALCETIAFAPDTFKPKCTLVTLQDDLKKLMEE